MATTIDGVGQDRPKMTPVNTGKKMIAGTLLFLERITCFHLPEHCHLQATNHPSFHFLHLVFQDLELYPPVELAVVIRVIRHYRLRLSITLRLYPRWCNAF